MPNVMPLSLGALLDPLPKAFVRQLYQNLGVALKATETRFAHQSQQRRSLGLAADESLRPSSREELWWLLNVIGDIARKRRGRPVTPENRRKGTIDSSEILEQVCDVF